MIKEKIEKIIELLQIPKDLKKTSGHILFRMHRALKENDLKSYCESESILFDIMGVNKVLESNLLTESEVQNLHDKIRYMVELDTSESHRLWEHYFKTDEASRGIEIVSKDDFKWDKLSENTVPDRKKIVVKTYDSETMEFEGEPVTAESIKKKIEQGIILMPSHVKKSDLNMTNRNVI